MRVFLSNIYGSTVRRRSAHPNPATPQSTETLDHGPWTMEQLQEEGIPCEETYGNDEKGDIILLDPQDGAQAQTVVEQIHQQFNDHPDTATKAKLAQTDEPHLEIKTQYLYGQEVDSILEKKTVVGIVSANKISKPSRKKLDNAGVAYAENVEPEDFAFLNTREGET